MMTNGLFAIFCFILTNLQLVHSKSPRVNIKNGIIEGVTITVNSSHGCNIFLGIPYASPPIGNLRFQKPSHTRSWLNVLDTKRYKFACMQPSKFLPYGIPISEDCLYLNVFAPNKNKFLNSKPSVLIWIHGGAFEGGTVITKSPNDICQNVIRNNLVIVTFESRLGPFGFLWSNESQDNVGMHDVVQVVQWVKENVKYFHADDNQIMLAGHGSGAAVASLLSLNETIGSLINGLILLSGSALAPWAVTDHSKTSTLKLLSSLNCTNVTCLRTKSAREIMQNAVPLWTPNIDQDLIADDPYSLLYHGQYGAVPSVHGFVADEGMLLAVKKLTSFNKPSTLGLLKSLVNNITGRGFEIFKMIYGLPSSNDNVLDHYNFMTKVYSESLFHAPMVNEAMQRAKKGNKTYIFMLDNANYHLETDLAFWYGGLMDQLVSQLLHQSNGEWLPISSKSSKNKIAVIGSSKNRNQFLPVPKYFFAHSPLKNVSFGFSLNLNDVKNATKLSSMEQLFFEQNEPMFWVLMGLAILFFLLFLLTSAACAAKNRLPAYNATSRGGHGQLSSMNLQPIIEYPKLVRNYNKQSNPIEFVIPTAKRGIATKNYSTK